MKLWSYIKDAMLENHSQIICEGEAEMTYEEVVIYAELFSKKLCGLKSCAILCGSEMAGAIALLSCFAAGVTAVPLSVRYGRAHSDKILDEIDPNAIISDIDGELTVIRISDSTYKVPQKHPALIMCTSGTTGRPKGVMLSEDNILANVDSIADYFKIDQSDSILISRPLYHCAVITGEFILSLINGARICFYSEKLNPKALLDIISEKKITVFCGTPTLLEMMARYMRAKAECPLKKIGISGESMSTSSAGKIAAVFDGAEIYYMYGLTEASPRVCFLPPYLFLKYPYSVGYPIKSVDIKVIKPDGAEADRFEEGVLWVKGPNVMLGYYNDPDKTAQVIKNGWLCTGDIATVDEYGMTIIRGRSDDLIIRAGINIYPHDVESTLKADKRVKEALVYRIDNPISGAALGLKISGDFDSTDDVRKMCLDRLPSFQMPSKIELVDELPKNGTGKIIRRVENA